MKVRAIIEEIFSGIELSKEDVEHLVWGCTGFPGAWRIPEDGNTPEECFRKQLTHARWYYDKFGELPDPLANRTEIKTREGGRPWGIKEQILEDLPSGLTLQFEVVPGDLDAPFRLRLFGKSLAHGNRELMFGPDGVFVASGTNLSGLCKPTWLELIAIDESADDPVTLLNPLEEQSGDEIFLEPLDEEES